MRRAILFFCYGFVFVLCFLVLSGWSRRWGTPQGFILTSFHPNPTKACPKNVPLSLHTCLASSYFCVCLLVLVWNAFLWFLVVSGWSRRWGTPQGFILTTFHPNPTNARPTKWSKGGSVPSKGVLGVPKKYLAST